jgi:hypothetical protein
MDTRKDIYASFGSLYSLLINIPLPNVQSVLFLLDKKEVTFCYLLSTLRGHLEPWLAPFFSPTTCLLKDVDNAFPFFFGSA